MVVGVFRKSDFNHLSFKSWNETIYKILMQIMESNVCTNTSSKVYVASFSVINKINAHFDNSRDCFSGLGLNKIKNKIKVNKGLFLEVYSSEEKSCKIVNIILSKIKCTHHTWGCLCWLKMYNSIKIIWISIQILPNLQYYIVKN